MTKMKTSLFITETASRDDVLDELLTERDEVAAQRKALGEAVRVLQDAAKASFTLCFLLLS